MRLRLIFLLTLYVLNFPFSLGQSARYQYSVEYNETGNIFRNHSYASSSSEFKWKLDSIVTQRIITEEDSESKEYPFQIQIFRFSKDNTYCGSHLIYSDYDTAQASYNNRYETLINPNSDTPAIQGVTDDKKWNQKVGRIQIVQANLVDTCIQVYSFDSTHKNWIKGALTCTTYSIDDSLSEKSVTRFANESYNPYSTRYVAIDSNGLMLKEIYQKKQNEHDEDWITTKQTEYKYLNSKLIERNDYLLSPISEKLMLQERRLWTYPEPNKEVYEYFGNESGDTLLYLNHKEIRAASVDSLCITTEYFNNDDNTQKLIRDRKVVQYLNESGDQIRESIFNYNNNSYDRVEKIYDRDEKSRVTMETVLYKMNYADTWDTLHVKTFEYGATNVNTKALIHIKSTNKNDGSPIDFYQFKTIFDSYNNLREFYHILTARSIETKVTFEYYHNILDDEVLYPSPTYSYVESAVGPWEKRNPVRLKTSYYYKNGQWLGRSKSEYFYSRL